jgi:hypothetical protein
LKTAYVKSLKFVYQAFFVGFSELFDDVDKVGVDGVHRGQNHSLVKLGHRRLKIFLGFRLSKKICFGFILLKQVFILKWT